MNVLVALIAIIVLVLMASLGAQVAGLRTVFGTVIPYVAIVLFLGGFVYRITKWMMAPVPFRITTTCGQQKSLSWIRSSTVENPHTTLGVVLRMAFEVLFFRSLFRNTKVEIKDGANVVHGPNKWLWLAGLVFHWSFLVVFLRHLRFFTEPVPAFVLKLQAVDGFFQLGVPVLYATSFLLLGALLFLFSRRMVWPQLRYISLANDYFPLFLLIGIATTGLLLRHVVKTDVVGVKELGIGLLSFNPITPQGIHYLFYVHLFLVCVLLAVFPFSKLMHMGGVFLSPTRNLANTNRMRRHVNPWDYPVKFRTYEEYEDEFRDKMKAAGIPVDKE